MLKDIEADAKLAFHVVDSVMNAFMSNPYQVNGTAIATFKTGREDDNLKNEVRTGSTDFKKKDLPIKI